MADHRLDGAIVVSVVIYRTSGFSGSEEIARSTEGGRMPVCVRHAQTGPKPPDLLFSANRRKRSDGLLGARLPRGGAGRGRFPALPYPPNRRGTLSAPLSTVSSRMNSVEDLGLWILGNSRVPDIVHVTREGPMPLQSLGNPTGGQTHARLRETGEGAHSFEIRVMGPGPRAASPSELRSPAGRGV